jgi:hypothetical protein
MIYNWSKWRLFPDPRNGEALIAPIGSGCYDLRLRSNRELILFGIGGNLAVRMSSLLPQPFGCGTRNNAEKRSFVLSTLGDIEYRTIATSTRQEAAEIERRFEKAAYRFRT